MTDSVESLSAVKERYKDTRAMSTEIVYTFFDGINRMISRVLFFVTEL